MWRGVVRPSDARDASQRGAARVGEEPDSDAVQSRSSSRESKYMG